MPEVQKPRKGSTGVLPRKRVSRIYPSLDSWVDSDECKPLAFAGYKAGMTQVTMKDLRKNSPTKNQLVSAPVTVLDIPPLLVLGARSYRDTYEGLKAVEDVGAEAENIPKDIRENAHLPGKDSFEEEDIDNIRLLVCTQPKRSGLGKKNCEMFEVPLGGELEEKKEYVEENVGEEIEIGDAFEEGEFLDAIAVTKGKGYEGPVGRYGAKIKPRKTERPRHVGSIGARGQGRVMYSAPQPGQKGFHRRTDEAKHLLNMGGEEVNPEDGFTNYGVVKESSLVLKGSVPGPKKRLVMLRKSIKKQEQLPVEIKNIKTKNQQGA